MRNATILVVRLKGTATEAIKNMVLAGIGKLIVVDSEEVTEEDLGAGFFFRDEDIGKKVRAPYAECYPHIQCDHLGQRLDAAKPRIESLNPLVTVETVTTASTLEGEAFDAIIQTVDLVCVTDWDRDSMVGPRPPVLVLRILQYKTLTPVTPPPSRSR